MCKHAECNVYIERYLHAGIEFDKNEACEDLKIYCIRMLYRKNKLIEEDIFHMPEHEIKNFEVLL